jgi:uncharacterized protein (UPF0333 family)
MFPLGLLATLALTGAAAYQYGKTKQGKKDAEAAIANANANKNNQTDLNKAQNVYNYNYLNDSNTGNTLFDSQQKTKRTIFGNPEKPQTVI